MREGRRSRSFPLKSSANFTNQPALIGSWGKAPTVECDSGSLLPGDRLFLMTDALAQWFLQSREERGRPWDTLAALLESERPEEAFVVWVEAQRESQALRNDDVTLLTVEFGPVREKPPRSNGV